jgi:allophanate hydrolase
MDLGVASLLERYRSGELKPSDVAAAVSRRIDDGDRAGVWITRVDRDELAAAAAALDGKDPSLPLYGIPFAVKDNIDVSGLPTTAACPGYATVATRTATVVQRLLDAGGLLVGKTNLDQFATGLVGTRSPYGAPSSVFDPDRVSGGSSSGSAVAVAAGHVAFALGTDTAGSGRVPAAFNELVGVKPSRGLLSTLGVVPACASLDCVTLLTRDVADAALVLPLVAVHDPGDPWSRAAVHPVAPRNGCVAVPATSQFVFDEPEAEIAWAAALARAAECWDLVTVDIAPLLDAAPLLYASWVAERTVDLEEVLLRHPEGLDPIVADIIRSGGSLSAVEAFAATHRLAGFRRAADPIWAAADALMLPTTPGHPTHAQVAADPVGTNNALGRFTNFVNLMDLAALAVPGPRRPDALPSGITLMAQAHHDVRLLELGAQWREEAIDLSPPGSLRVAVVGAHLSGLPLNHQLTDRGARLVAATQTAPCYRLHALPGGQVARPGLVRVCDAGAAIAAEVWELAPAAFGAFLAEIPPPLALGTVELADGSAVTGFVCEAYAIPGAPDITSYGGWRAYMDSQAEAAAA